MNISFGGLGNGIDFGQIVDFLIQAERIPIDRKIETRLSSQEKLTDLGSLGSKLLSLQTTASSLRTRVGFDKTKIDVSTASTKTLLTATASSVASAGTYTVKVNQLAASHQLASTSTTAVSDTSTDIVSGSSATFSFQVGSGSTQTVDLASDATLDDLKNAINDLGAGVSASTLNTGSEASPEYRLVLTSNDTGASNAITIVTDTTTLDVSASGTGTDTLQSAQDAQIELGNPNDTTVTLDRSSNTITDAISGVTLNLQGIDASETVSITVNQDPAAVKEGIQSLVAAYNEVLTFVNERTVFNVETQERGLFVGETIPRTVLDQLRRALSDQVSGLSTITTAGEIGFQTQATDGTIILDEADLDKQLSENYSALRDLFIENPTTGTTGLAERLVDAIDTLDDVETGALTIRQNSLSDEIDDLADQIALMESDLLRFEEQQRIKFANLDGLVASLQSQLNSLNSLL